MKIYLDLETIPSQDPEVRQEISDSIQAPGNYSKPESIAKWVAECKPALEAEAWLKTAMDGAWGQIVCAAMAIDDEEPLCLYDEDWFNNEKHIITHLFDRIKAKYSPSRDVRPVFIGHNIVNFDLRFLYQRAVVHGIKPPSIIPFDAKPWDDKVFDTMVKWSGVGKTVSLGKLCKIFKLPAKGSEIGEEIDGSLVWTFVRAGRIRDVAKYCMGDVERVRALHKRMTFATSERT
jgi:hypothetical protein